MTASVQINGARGVAPNVIQNLGVIMYLVLRIVRGIFGAIAGWQVIGMLPVTGWLQNLGAVTSSMWAVLALKLVLLLLFCSLFFGMRLLINRLHIRLQGSPHPALVKTWSL